MSIPPATSSSFCPASLPTSAPSLALAARSGRCGRLATALPEPAPRPVAGGLAAGASCRHRHHHALPPLLVSINRLPEQMASCDRRYFWYGCRFISIIINHLQFTGLPLPSASVLSWQPPVDLLTLTFGITTSVHCYNQPLQPVVSSSWQHNADKDGHLPLPPLPPPTRPRGPQLGTPAVTLTNHPSIHPWSWSWCYEWNIINNIGNIFPTNNCRFMTRPRRNKKNVADESLKWLCFHSRPQTWHRIFKTNVIY